MSSTESTGASGRPNLLLVVIDSVRTANISAYGYERPTAPTLDRLAEEGTLYEQAISVGCWTLPVHASLFTGLYPSSHGLVLSKDALPDGYPTLAGRLGELGYQTACFSNNPYVSGASGLSQGFDAVDDLWRGTRPQGTARPPQAARLRRLQERGRLARPLIALAPLLRRPRSLLRAWKRRRSQEDMGARRTNERIRRWLEARDAAAPFFVFVNYMENHERYLPPYPHNRRFLPPRTSLWRLARAEASKAEILSAPEARRGSDLAIVRGLYDGALNYLDERVGELLGHLESLGLADETAVVVASDHGDSLGEHDHLGHRLHLYEQLVHVPLIIRYPARFPAGGKVSHQVSLGDLHPTLLELAGAGEAHGGHFRSLLDPVGHTYTVAENTAPKSLDNVVSRMIRGDRHKYIWKSSGRHELYDLQDDPGETENLVDVRPDLARSLADELETWERSLEGDSVATREADYDDATLQRLRGLGYIG